MSSPSVKNIEKALGIADDVSKMGVDSRDEEKKELFKKRQEKLKQIQEEFESKRKNYEQDKDFIKDVYRELAETSMMAVRIMQEEAGLTGDYKNVEALAAAANAVSTALAGLKDVEHDEEKLRIEREKIQARKDLATIIPQKSNITNTGPTNVFVGSTADLIRELKKQEKEQKIIETTAEKITNDVAVEDNKDA